MECFDIKREICWSWGIARGYNKLYRMNRRQGQRQGSQWSQGEDKEGKYVFMFRKTRWEKCWGKKIHEKWKLYLYMFTFP